MPVHIQQIPSNIFLILLKKFSFRDLYRLRQTCRKLYNFVEQNAENLKPTAPFQLIFCQENNPQHPHQQLVRCHVEQLDKDSPTNYLLLDPKNQISSVHFDKIFICNGGHYEDCSEECKVWPTPCLKTVIMANHFSCETLKILYWNRIETDFDLLLNIDFKYLEITKMDKEMILRILQKCKQLEIENLDISFHDLSILFFLRSVIIGAIHENSREADKMFEELLLILKKNGPKNLKFLQFPSTEPRYLPLEDRTNYRSLDCALLGIVQLFEGEKRHMGKMNLYLMELASSQVAIIAQEHYHFHYRIYIIENSFNTIVETLVVEFLSRNWNNNMKNKLPPIDYSILYEELEDLEKGEWSEVINEFLEQIIIDYW